mgnify:CR=1 FL=1
MLEEESIIRKVDYARFEAVVNMIGGKWKLRIMYMLAFHTVLRYGELKKLLGSISHRMLSNQLKELERDGLIVRTEYSQIPPKVEYHLSPKGIELRPIFEQMCNWIFKYLP